MKKILFFFLGIGLFPIQLPADTGSLSLHQALEIARSLSPDVVLARHDTSISQSEGLKANRYPNPEIDFMIGPNFEDIPGGGNDKGVFIGGSIQQEIPLWGQRGLRKKIAEDQVTLAKIQEIATTNDVEEKIKILYAAIQRGEERTGLIQENIKIAERFVGSAQIKFQQNQAPYADVLRAKMELAQQHKNLLRERSDLKILKSQMNFSLGRELETPFSAGDGFQSNGNLPSLEELLARTGSRPEFQAIEVQKGQNEKEIRLAQQEWKPNLRLGVFAEKDAPDTHFGPTVGMEIPIGYRNRGEIEAAKAKSKKIEYQKDRLGRGIELEVKNKYLELQNTQQALGLQREAIQNTVELFRTTLQAYLEGKADFLRFLETLESVNVFKSEYYDILFDYFVKKAELERAVGTSF